MPSAPDEASVPLSLHVTPTGCVLPSRTDDFGYPLPHKVAARIEKAFERGTGHGLVHLGAEETTAQLGPTTNYWRDLSRLYFTKVCTLVDVETEVKRGLRIGLEPEEASGFLAGAPPMLGMEYLSEEVLRGAWAQIQGAFLDEIGDSGLGAEAYIHAKNPLWRSVGRIFFHVAENKARPDRPFAFLATYTSKISAQGKVQHVPLGRAVQSQARAADREKLLSLLVPVQRAAEESQLLRDLVESGRIFHPQVWTPEEAYRFLREASLFEAQGIFLRLPDWWNTRRRPRVTVSVTMGEKKAAGLGADALLDFSVDVCLGDEKISEKEWREILESSGGLALVKGRWVEVDREKLRNLLDRWKRLKDSTGDSGVSFLESMRLLSGLSGTTSLEDADSATPVDAAEPWVSIQAGKWLRRILEELRDPSLGEGQVPREALRTQLRPYQEDGVRWLWLLHRLRLGGCLADDMGLGKTIQVLALLLLIRRRRKDKPGERVPPAILVVPASLIANWKSECFRFAPDLRLFVAHPSEAREKLTEAPPRLKQYDAVITTYGMLSRQAWLTETDWGLAVLDEAQAIKNPSSRQTRAAKSIKALQRLALTGTPVENRLGDLWSLFDFLNPGLLGSAKEFSRQTGREAGTSGEIYSRLRSLVRPYILRRLKTDKRIITDLPDKQEVKIYCGLKKPQVVLYHKATEELAAALGGVDGIQRRGAILSFLMRFKQICNHPSQWTGDGVYDPGGSAKMERLIGLCEEIAARQEKALVFSQFKEMTGVLANVLEPVFGRAGVVLDGNTPVKKRRSLVEAFQHESGPPFFVLSLKAGGTGLNLTAASHVIHFDRWWNPAVEDQATDRAYRIGQKKNVLVHKFVCQGTIEEKIEALIESKRQMSDSLLKDGAEAALTEMSNEELLEFVSLDKRRVLTEG